jgi:DNA-binding CsgD family transcriptional regulator
VVSDPSPILARALCGRADTLLIRGRVGEGTEDARRGLAMANELEDLASEALALISMSQAAYFAGDFGESVRWARQACRIDPDAIPGELARDSGFRLTVALMAAGDLAAARASCTDALAMAQAAGDLPNEAYAMVLLTRLDVREGSLADGWPHLDSALRLSTRVRDQLLLRQCLGVGGELCAVAGRWADAATVWAAYLAIMRGSELSETAAIMGRRAELLQAAAQALGPERMRAAEERGAAMNLDTAAEFLLMLTGPDLQAARTAAIPAELSKLSAREQELVTLVAQGQTDAQIAGRLFISVSTVRSHLDRIRDKTGCRRRAELTRLALQEGLV